MPDVIFAISRCEAISFDDCRVARCRVKARADSAGHGAPGYILMKPLFSAPVYKNAARSPPMVNDRFRYGTLSSV